MGYMHIKNLFPFPVDICYYPLHEDKTLFEMRKNKEHKFVL